MEDTLVPPDDPLATQADEVTVRAQGEIDMVTAPGLRNALLAAVNERPTTVVLDLTDVTFLDSSGLDALVTAQRTAAAMEVGIVLSSLPAHCRTVLEITGLDRVFTIR
jgi:anti-sigma B factor antagonist